MKSCFLTSLLLIFSILPNSAFAFFCPNNFQIVQPGDTIDSVIQRCGKPDSTRKIQGAFTGSQEWIYNVNVANQGSLRMSVMLLDDKITNITSNNMSLTTTTICGAPVALGDTSASLKSACGDPALVNRGSGSNTDQTSPPEAPADVEFTYKTSPPVIFVFQKGLLTERKQGF